MTSEKIRKEIKKLAKEYVDLLEKEKSQQVKTYIPASGKVIGFEELSNMIDASLDMWLTSGRFNDQFEEAFAKKLGVRFALTTNSGSSANLLAFSALTSHKLKDRALKRGDEVISVASGFPTTINPIIQSGLIPVFVDCDVGTYNISVDKIEEAISCKTKAIFLAHTLGNMYDMDRIMEIAREHNLWVIEDSCDALGAKWKNKYAGTIGHIGTYSFYPAHHITMGEGGAVVTNDPLLYRIIMSFRDWGRDCWCKPGCDNTCTQRFNMCLGQLPKGYDHKYTYSHIGYNLKITDWQASIGLAQLMKLDHFLEVRKNNAEMLLKSLEDLDDYFIFPKILDDCVPSWFGLLLSLKNNEIFDKNELVVHLEKNGIGTRQLFAGNILRHPMVVENDFEMRIGNSPVIKSSDLNESFYNMLPGTEYIMNNTFWVGVSPNNNINDMKKISETIHNFIWSKVK